MISNDDGERLFRLCGGSSSSVAKDERPAHNARWTRRANEFSKPYRDRIAELEAQCAAKDQTIDAIQAAANIYRADCDRIAAREADLHVMLRAFGLPTEPKALARELNGRDVDGSELEAENANLTKAPAPCTCPPSSEYDPPCPQHGAVGMGFSKCPDLP